MTYFDTIVKQPSLSILTMSPAPRETLPSVLCYPIQSSRLPSSIARTPRPHIAGLILRDAAVPTRLALAAHLAASLRRRIRRLNHDRYQRIRRCDEDRRNRGGRFGACGRTGDEPRDSGLDLRRGGRKGVRGLQRRSQGRCGSGAGLQRKRRRDRGKSRRIRRRGRRHFDDHLHSLARVFGGRNHRPRRRATPDQHRRQHSKLNQTPHVIRVFSPALPAKIPTLFLRS
jgi:hypothetical protein